MSELSNLADAVAYAKRGWYVAPANVDYDANGKKRVEFLVPWGSEASCDVEVVRDWYVQRPYAGVAIATKPSGLVVVDLDVKGDGLDTWHALCAQHGNGEAPQTYAVATPTGGLHLYFLDPANRAVNSARKLGTGIDVRGGGQSNGGVVFAPPTKTRLGAYEVVDDRDPVALPEWLWTLIEKPAPAAPVVAGEYDPLFSDGFTGEPADEDGARARVKELAVQLGALSGPGGNDEASRIAFMAGQYVGAGQLDAREVVGILRTPILRWEGQTGQQSTWHATIENQVREGAKRPRPWIAERKAEVKAQNEAAKSEAKVRRVLEFGDATIAEVIAEDVLRSSYARTKGLGWLKWTGTYWKQCDDGAPVEAVRRYVKSALISAIKKEGIGSAHAKGWATYNSAGKIGALVSLAGNMDGVLREVAEFDAHPDLLNTPGGVLDLESGNVLEHTPELLLTKITRGRYVPGMSSEAFSTLLTAVPDDALEWLRAHCGQGVSGRPKPRVPAVLLTGGGRNGKSLLMETVLHSLGGLDGTGYGVQVPHELLLMGKAAGGPSPEKLMLRGARFAYVEETPEGRFLDVQALKKVVGTGLLSGRDMYKPLVTFPLTHILFINTNHPPRVTETDSATWDRLSSLRFPYRFRKPNDDLGAWLDTDRHGDVALAATLTEQQALDACLTWLVDGYRAGAVTEVSRPESVEASVKEWRREGDIILRFVEDVFEYDADSWVTNAALYAALQRWSEVNGQQKPPPLQTFISRLRSHTGLGQKVSSRKVHSDRSGLSLPDAALWVVEGAASRRPVTQMTNGVVGLRFQKAVVVPDNLFG